MIKLAIPLLLWFSISNSIAAEYLDTQYGQDGLEMHLLKAKVSNNVLTVSFLLENSTESKVKFTSMVVADANYTSGDKKYPPLKDANGKWLASTITYEESNAKGALFTNKESPFEFHTMTLKKGQKSVGWLKFEAPDDTNWPIELSLPGVSPFTIEKP